MTKYYVAPRSKVYHFARPSNWGHLEYMCGIGYSLHDDEIFDRKPKGLTLCKNCGKTDVYRTQKKNS